MEDLFEQHFRANDYLRHATGMLLVGILFYALVSTSGHYHIAGVGYATVQDILSGTTYSIGFLLILFALKLAATSLTLGSGGSGGIFSPALFLGATLGSAYGVLLNTLFPGMHASAQAFAVAGMAGMVGGTTGAAIAAIVMIFEMTRDYNVIVPMTIAVALSYGIRKLLVNESIYTLKLVRRGHYVPEALQTNLHYMKLARDLQEKRMVVVPAGQTLAAWLASLPSLPNQARLPCYLVEDEARVVGVLNPETALRAAAQRGGETTVGTLVTGAFSIINENTTLFEMVARLEVERVEIFLVTPTLNSTLAADITGWISKKHIAESMGEAIDLFTNTPAEESDSGTRRRYR